MEPLVMDGSTLPALKDILPEHFYEQSEQAMRPSQSEANLPHLPNGGPHSQYLQQQQNSGTQQQGMQFTFENVIPNGEYGSHYPSANPHGRGGRGAKKRSYEDDDVHAPQPQPQDPYFMGPSGPIHQPSASQDVHLHLPSTTLTHDGIHDDDGEGDDDVGDLNDGEKRRHTCPRCGKRFNRPSSLKIHLNTHTGAKPYACPFQGCGRTFNVSSNMRRHFRNHARRPAPPPLPPNSIYSGPVSDQQEVSRARARPPQLGSNAQHQPQPLPYDGSAGFRDSPEYMKQFYPPSSDMRNSRSGQDNKQFRHGALMTPPYTNEGSEYDQENQTERSAYSQMPPYYAFGNGPGQLGPNAAFGNMDVGTPGMHVSMGFPGIGGGPSQMFPVDPSLASGRHGNDVETGGEADADGELDPDIEHDADTQGDKGNGEMRRIGPSTSNARASSNPKADNLRGEALRTISADGIVNVPVSIPFANTNGIPTPAGSGPGEVQFQQALLPMPTSAANDPVQVALYAQQYQAHCAQQQRQYQHQQQQTFQSGANVMYGGGTAFGIPTFPLHMPPGQVSYPNEPYVSHSNMQQQAALSVRGNGRNANDAIGMHRDREEIGQQRSNELTRLHAQDNIRAAYDMQNLTPGAAPAPPYKLYSRPSTEISESKLVADKTGDPSLSDGADTLEDADSSDGFGEDDYDDDDYTGRPISKRGRGAKSSGTRGRPRGRPRGSGRGSGITRGSGRGRGRPRKSVAATEPGDAKGDEKSAADFGSQQIEENDGRITRSRLRTRTSEKA